MKYAKEIAEFKAQVKAVDADPDRDNTRPVKGSRYFEIMVWGLENDQAYVELRFGESFRRMFGRDNHVWLTVFRGSLKEACQVARDLKAETGLRIGYLEYQESVLY